MVRLLAVAIVIAGSAMSVHAEVSVDLRAPDPVAALPAVSADKLNFLRAYRRWQPTCKQPDIFVEDGGIEMSVDEPQYSSTQLIGGCGEALDAFSGNVNAVNASMSNTKCGSAALRGTVTAKLPATFEAAGMRIDVSAAATSAHVTINRLASDGWTGGRRMSVDAAPIEVRGWYVVELKTTRQLAVLIATKAANGVVTERWMEIWATKPAGKPAPITVARTWLLAVAAHDASALARVTAAPFERVGFVSNANAGAGGCATKRTAKKAKDLAPVIDCVLAEASARYVELYDEQEFFALDLRKLPPELAGDAAALRKLAKAGHALVQFATSDARGSVTVALAIKNGKVAAAIERPAGP